MAFAQSTFYVFLTHRQYFWIVMCEVNGSLFSKVYLISWRKMSFGPNLCWYMLFCYMNTVWVLLKVKWMQYEHYITALLCAVWLLDTSNEMCSHGNPSITARESIRRNFFVRVAIGFCYRDDIFRRCLMHLSFKQLSHSLQCVSLLLSIWFISAHLVLGMNDIGKSHNGIF